MDHATHHAFDDSPMALRNREIVDSVGDIEPSALHQGFGNFLDLGAEETLAVICHPTPDHAIEETVTHLVPKCAQAGRQLARRDLAHEHEPALLPVPVNEVGHARELMREGRLKSHADISVNLLAEVGEPCCRLVARGTLRCLLSRPVQRSVA